VLRKLARVCAGVLLALACACGCKSPEATRTRGSGPGADVGNHGSPMTVHPAKDPYYKTPLKGAGR
jgi:hypothetical protein